MHIYGSVRQQLASNDWTATAASGGTTTASRTVNVYAQIETRVGLNLLSASKNVTVSTGQKLSLTVNTGAIKSGEDAFAVVFSIETTGNPADAVQVAKIKLRDDDQTTIRTLPLTINLTKDSHFALAASVANSSSLPANPINGQMRSIGANYYEYDDEATEGNYQSGGGYWIEKSDNFYTYLATTVDEGGCDRHQTLINEFKHELIPYAGNGNDHTPLVIWLLNGLTEDGQPTIPIGSDIALEVKVNGSVPLAESLSKGIKVKVLGYVRRSTGVLDTTIPQAGTTYVWQLDSPIFTLTQAIPRGYALAVQIILSFKKSQLRGGITGGEPISTILYTQGKFGSYNPVGFFTGNAIANLGNKMRLLPTTGGFTRSDGLAIIENHVTPLMGEETYAVTVADTANQQIALSGIFAGEAFIYQSGETIPAGQKLRAKFSTQPGEQTPGDWSNIITLSSGQLLNLTVDHPCDSTGICSIRSNYPDSLIAGMQTKFTAPYFRLYLSVNGVLYRANTLTAATLTDTQGLTIDSLSGFSVVGSLPTNGDSAFGFWDYETPTLAAATGSSSLPTGQAIKFCFAYATATSNNRVITKIAHEGLEEIPYPLIEAIVRAGAYGLAKERGVSLPIRGAYNFLDPLFELTDDSQNNETEITLPGVRRIYEFNTAPTVEDDETEGYRLGDRWFDLSQNPITEYVCVNPTEGTWQAVGSGGQNGGHLIVNSAGDSLAQQPNLKFNNSFFSLSNSSGTSTTLINIAYSPVNQATVIGTENGLTGGGSLSANRTLGLSYTGLTAETSPLLTDIVAIQTASGIRKVTLSNLLTKLPFVTKGSILVGNGSSLIEFPVGTNGFYLVADSSTVSGYAWAQPNNTLNTTISAPGYVQPSLNSTVNINVGSTGNFLAGLTYLTIETGGRYLVTALGGETSCTIQYLGSGANPGVQIAAGKKVSISGKPGSDGITPQTYTNEQFTVPAINSTVDVTVLSTVPFNVGITININSAGDYLLTEVSSSTVIKCQNLGGTNTSPGVTIETNNKVIITGRKGDNLSDTQVTSKVLTNFAESTTTAISSTDTILQAFNKISKFLSTYFSSFNAPNKLVQLDGTGKLPALDGSQLTGISGGGSGNGFTILSANNNLSVNKEYWNKTASITVNLPETSLTNQDVIKISNILNSGSLTVQNSFDSLVITGLSINYFIYLSNSDNWKVYDNTLTLIKTLKNSNTGTTLIYSSFGDTNGLFYYLGTTGGTVSWTNPCPSKVAIENSGAVGTSNAGYYVDRDTSVLTPSGGSAGIYETFQLLTEISFTLKRYTLQFVPGSGSDKPLQWELSGSNNGSSWTVLHNQNTDYNWVSNSYNYLSPLLTSNTTAYNYYKLAMIGLNSGGGNSMKFAEIEFYGELT